MARKGLRLDLSRQQLLVFSAHLLVYLECQKAFRDGPSIETVKDIGSRVFALCSQDQAPMTLTLTGGETRALTLVLRLLVPCYSEGPPSANRTRALRDLAMCRALLQRARRHPARKTREESHA